MAPSRGKGKAKATVSQPGPSATPKRTTRSSRRSKDVTPDVYQDMLAEAAVTDHGEISTRPLKRRKVATAVSEPDTRGPRSGKGKAAASATGTTNGESSHGQTGLQTIEASSDDDDESDFAFEDVDLEQPSASSPAAPTSADEDVVVDVSISLDPKTTPKRQVRKQRKPASAAEKAYRLLVHKAHLLTLLGHCIYVNSWCNDEAVHSNLEGLLSAKGKLYLRANSRESQFDRNRMFMEGLQQASEAFRGRFQVTASGLRRARWPVDGKDAGVETDDELKGRAEMLRASKRMEGSQDMGNQLFCALLRSVGVEARVVCSLQPLPFTTSTAKTTPQKPIKRTVYAGNGTDSEADKTDASVATDHSVRSSTSVVKIPQVRRRLGQPSFTAPSPAAATPPKEKRKPVRKLAYPIFWTEAFNAAHQKWIPVDPVVTTTINKPAKLEPPASYEHNQLSYAIAFEADGVARDVTRRYAKAYNAKTRRQRVEATENGTGWWKKALRILRPRGQALDRDQVEDAELAAKEAREGLPGNVQDFKGHPYYALERHLRRHEVLHPRREVGKVNAGTAAKPRVEAVFRRSDVLACRSADKWYRLGREVKEGEQPLKHVPARRGVRLSADEDGEEAAQTTALYAPFQTAQYTPPPVVRGRVPRNAFGNLDIYVPSMVPAGGTHIRHPLTATAAKLLNVDYADAVAGFQFKGRQGTAVIEGAVVPGPFAEAVRAVIEGLEFERELDVCRARSLQALKLWRRFVKGLEIAERVKRYGDGSARTASAEEETDAAVLSFGDMGADGAPLLTAGQYSLADLLAPARATPKKRRKFDESEEEQLVGDGGDSDEAGGEYGEGGFVAEEGSRALPSRSTRSRRIIVDDDDDEGEDGDGEVYVPNTDPETTAEGEDGGGFLVPDEDDAAGDGGGFLVPEEDGANGDGGGFLAADHVDEPDGAGGFVAEKPMEEDGGGGGFMADDEQEDEGGRGFVADEDDVDHGGGGFMPHADEPAERVSDSSATTSILPEAQQHHLVFEAVVAPEQATERLGTRKAVNQRQNDGDESDKGSLLSHDPEDEDAEPDWLESD